ncbi:hypothetical protein KIH39_09670 [Telmatocola sphagniphila]|uniref:NADH dehydrogenase subunit 5 n=1 Tax=Telmatocola sphagniphila TaxID=1123043 RepID=A0A8E6B8M0_9BACT|nr:proton-conducting transporter membrane subunit [Telmatocola sphagniphila]QVL34155.1 hypothetical protein KIH39_09670 [Telmatocola sphagniphila]
MRLVTDWDLPIFRIDRLNLVMAALIIFVAVNVFSFSRRYLAGDRQYRRHLAGIIFLALSVLGMVFADHLAVMLIAWGISNFLLVRLMIHKSEWRAAWNSGMLAFKTFALGFVLLTIGFGILSEQAGSSSISRILDQAGQFGKPMMTIALALIVLAAVTQSAAWPFHKWLLSSLNSPTPVSALMHAGLVNGGGFLLVRFAPMFQTQPILLHSVFVLGLISAVLGTSWKLIQTDIKRMLACSTLGQMGFMLMQCGMGLFAPAISHLCWHGLFKAYLFLSASSVLEDPKRKAYFGSRSFVTFLLALGLGVPGAFAFLLISGLLNPTLDTRLLLVGLAFMTCCQLAGRVLETGKSLSRILGAAVASIFGGGLYGLSIFLIDVLLEPLHLMTPQPLDVCYVTGFGFIGMIWLFMNLNGIQRFQNTELWKRLYMSALNSSQPSPHTITNVRAQYHY